MVTTVTDNSPQSINTSLFSLDKEVQEIKKVTDKLTGINTEANVISVNGKQGIVELNASDVNALPDTTVIPTTTSELENTSGFITSSDSITGNAATATRAEQDANGNVITDTYATKELIANETSERKTADEALQTQITANKNAIDTLNGTGTGSVKKTVTDEIAKVVANAPEDFDTLKEISDWIDTHEDSASAMNTQILANKNEIASLKTEVAGKSDIGHTHSASDITSGTLPIARGGTGQTTQADINKAFVGGLEEGIDNVTDGTEFVSSWANDNGFAEKEAFNVPFKRKFSAVWNYIKGKISSVLGLTASNYGGKASTAGTADSANALAYRGSIQNTDTFQAVMNNDGKWNITDLNPGWYGSLYTLNAGGSQSGLMFRIVGGNTGPNQVQMNYSIDGNRFGMGWATLINSGNIGAQTVAKATQDASGNVITDTYATKTALSSGLSGKSDTGHTHTKSQITDFPTSLPANGGTADKATKDGNGNNIANTYMPKSGGTFTGLVTGTDFHAGAFYPKDSIDSYISFQPDVNGETKLIVSGSKSLKLDSTEGDIFLKSGKEENALNKVVAKSYKVCTVNATTGLENYVTGANLTDYQKKVLKKIFGALLLGKCLNIRIIASYNVGSSNRNVIGDIIGYVEPSSGYTGTEKDGVTIKIDNSGDDLCYYCYLGTINENGDFVSYDVYYLLDKICKGDFSIITRILVYATIMENWV